MIIQNITVHKFRAFKHDCSLKIGKRLTAICGMNRTQKSTLLGMLGQCFTISKNSKLYGYKTLDGFNFRSQFAEKFKLSDKFDSPGEHEWTLELNKHVYPDTYFTMASMLRDKKSKAIRFWKKGTRTKGSGYVQVPVYFLSLSRLFPIGETGKGLHDLQQAALNKDELTFYRESYNKIFQISLASENSSFSVSNKIASGKKIFSGVNDDNHDFLTNSSGETNIGRILLAVLSFRRLKQQFGQKEYKGGVLLIDELDATLHGAAQKGLLNFLNKVAREYNIQIIFTTHSPTILYKMFELMSEYNYKQKNEEQEYITLWEDYEIITLKRDVVSNGKDEISGKNTKSRAEIDRFVALMDLTRYEPKKLEVYCEDDRAFESLSLILKSTDKGRQIFIKLQPVPVNLGWTNYLYLAEKGMPAIINALVVLDADAKSNMTVEQKQKCNNFENFLISPLTVEVDFYEMLKKSENYLRFKQIHPEYNDILMSYETTFETSPVSQDKSTNDYKKWFEDLCNIVDFSDLQNFWISLHQNEVNKFVEEFLVKFNKLYNKQ